VPILRVNHVAVESTLPALWKASTGRMNLRSGNPLFVLAALVFAIHLTGKASSLAAAVVILIGSGAARLYSRFMPRCIHSESIYSFPRTFAGKTTRTCCKCGHKREYDMATMRFLTGHFVSTS
jgi:hypothetical protein